MDSFREYFVLIGGAACDVAFDNAGLEFRATKDLDIVLCVEVLDRSFVESLWAFIHKGGYQVHQKATGKKQFYRFSKPKDSDFPFMLEFFSRVPDAIELEHGQHLVPIPVARIIHE